MKKGLNLHYHEAPSRYILNSVREYRDPEEFEGWFCTVFFEGRRYCGVLDEDICAMGSLEEIEEDMARKKMIQIRIDDHLHRWLKTFAAEQGVSMTDIITKYISYLKAKAEESVEVTQI